MGGLEPSSSSRSIFASWYSSGMNGHSALSVAFILPVSSSINMSDVSFLPTNTLTSSLLTDVNGDMSTSWDMENGNRWSGEDGEWRM